MVQKQLIIDSFQELGYDVDDEVANQCVILCKRYNIAESSFVDYWVAFSMSGAEDILPTADNFAAMEKKMLTKNSTNTSSRNSSKTWEDDELNNKREYDSTPMMTEDYEAYGCESERASNSEVKTPKSTLSHFKSNGDVTRRFAVASPKSLFSPASFSPIATAPSKKYSERTNAGHVLSRYGSNSDAISWKTDVFAPVKVSYTEDFFHIPNNARFMFETFGTRIIASRKLADTICLDILDKLGMTRVPTDVNSLSMDTTTYAGKIMCDSVGKLNTSSILLDSCLHTGKCEYVQLQVADLPEYSLFPGQIVVIEGRNPTGQTIIAEKIYTDVKLLHCPVPAEFLRPREPLQIIIAAGPYTLSDTLSYQPWEDLTDYVVKNRPHVLILIGPIIDCLHPLVADNNIHEPFSVFFDRQLSNLLNRLQDAVSTIHTKVVLVSSWRDVGQMDVYPTPCIRTSLNHPSLFLAPDPCMLDINGFQIGITSADILMHLGKEELFCSATGGMDRLGRLASHLLMQRSFYPLMPAAEEMSIDMDLFIKHGVLPHIPHMLILPSDLKQFIKNIKGCLVVNPERLAKGQIGGTFARVQVTSAEDGGIWATDSHVSAQIVKL